MLRIERLVLLALSVVWALTAGCGTLFSPSGNGGAEASHRLDVSAFRARADVLAKDYFETNAPGLPRDAETMGTFLAAKELYDAGRYAESREALDAFWARYPMGEAKVWGIERIPASYTMLQVITECARARTSPDWFQGKPEPLGMTAVFIDKGPHTGSRSFLDPRVTPDCPEVHRAVSLFGEYLKAITGGRIQLVVHVVLLPNFVTPITTPDASGERWVDFAKVAKACPPEVRASTGIWWLFAPTPEGVFNGGMTWLPGGAAHFMGGSVFGFQHPEYDQIIWLQHEFWHYLFGLYTEFELEPQAHHWWYREKWPVDFVGNIESDYYREALHKRIQPRGKPPLYEKLLGMRGKP